MQKDAIEILGAVIERAHVLARRINSDEAVHKTIMSAIFIMEDMRDGLIVDELSESQTMLPRHAARSCKP